MMYDLFNSLSDSIGATSFHCDLRQANAVWPLQQPVQFAWNNFLKLLELCLGCMSFGVPQPGNAQGGSHSWLLAFCKKAASEA